MPKPLSIALLLVLLLTSSMGLSGQSCSNLNLQVESDIVSTCDSITMTSLHDRMGRSYLYVAHKGGGVKVYDISNLSSPNLVASVPASRYNDLHAMNLTQAGNYVYVALGSHFPPHQQSGMAIIDVTNPLIPVVTDYYIVPGSSNGAGIVQVEGDLAYLGAMSSGLVILNVTDKQNITQVSQFIPDLNYPPIANPDSAKINARGMEVKNGIVYLCHDAGGLRIINCTNPQAPVETGRYANPATYIPFNRPRAYNNIVIQDSLAYIAVDYCGMEVLNISDTSNITLHGWWNPYNCPSNNWFTSPTHTNEMHLDPNCQVIFFSTGKSEMVVIDISDPANPDSCNAYGSVLDTTGTWGIDVYDGNVFLAYICSPLWPFVSLETGVKILSYNTCAVGVESNLLEPQLTLYPNPANEQVMIQTGRFEQPDQVRLFNSLGKEVTATFNFREGEVEIDVKALPAGMYFVDLEYRDRSERVRFLVR